MNLLFVCYGDFTANGMSHIAAFANMLCDRGHEAMVAVPRNIDSLRVVREPRFRAALFSEVLSGDARFSDGRPADLVHAWTPRELVRKFILAYVRRTPTRVVIHLEDNEDHLIASHTGLSLEQLLGLSEQDLSARVDEALSHPRRSRLLLAACDGATVIVPKLSEFLPAGLPRIDLAPGLDPAFLAPTITRDEARRAFGLPIDGHVIAYPGSSTFANEAELRTLYAAVAQLNTDGLPVTLVRAGLDTDIFAASIPASQQTHVRHLGFLERAKIPTFLAAGDLLVQPGAPGPFNDYRLPSKLPEYFAAGRPVVLPASNIGLKARHGIDAWVLADGHPETIAAACATILRDPRLAGTLAANAAAFAREHFDLARQTDRLLEFYARVLATPSRAGALSTLASVGTEVTLAARSLAASLPSLAGAEAHAALAAHLAPLVEELEQPDAATRERDLARDERDAWRNRFDATRAHLRHVEEQQSAQATHAAHLEAQLSASTGRTSHLETQLSTSIAHASHLETQLSASTAHAAHLETQLSASIAHASHLAEAMAAQGTHARNLEATIATLQSERENERIRLEATTTALLEARHAVTGLKAERQSLESARDIAQAQVSQLSERATRLSATIHELEAAIVRRDAKIRTLETSFSWRVTLPFRWLRRTFLDPRSRQPAAPPPLSSTPPTTPTPAAAPPAAPPPPSTPAVATSPALLYGLPHSVDEPRGWTLAPRRHLLRGWVFHPDGNELNGIRAVLGTRVIDGVYGLKRLDVAASVRGQPQAEFCGWRIEVDLTEADTTLEIQALEESGVWLPFFRTGLRVGADLGPADLSRYEEWIRVYDTASPETLASQRARAGEFEAPPKISVIMPVYNTPERWLRRVIESVTQQTYPHWELCIADDASTQPHVRRILEEVAAAEPRIKLTFRTANGHISASSNSALALATGEFVALLDHDDELAPHALFEVALTLGRHPDADLLYSDEDKIDEDGRRFEPYFKPDWNPDLFLGQNYLSHLSVYRASLVREVGGFRTGYEGSQDWDLALRVTERIAPAHIVHIPRVLYHWRAIAGSTALQLSEKSYPVEAARRALEDHIARRALHAHLKPVPGDHWRVVHALPAPAPLVSIIIPTRNSLAILRRCVDSIRTRTDYPRFEIIIIDNQSDDPETIAWLGSVACEEVRVVPYPATFNYSAINNTAVRAARGDVVALLNNDLEVINPDWLAEMVGQACREGVGCVGAMLYYPNDMVQHAGVILGVGGVAGHAFRDLPRGTEGVFNRARLVQNYSAVTAACLVVRKAVYEQVGGLDEVDLAVAFNDIDFCLKVRAAGYRNLWTPFAELYHHESASRGSDDTPEKKARFDREVEIMLRRWGPALSADPAYNPNLTLERNDFSLAIPPRPARL